MTINYTTKHKTEMIEEIRECSLDIVYFAEKYFTIINFKNGKEVIKLPQFQKNLLYNFVEKKNTVVLAPRQSFKTTTSLIYALWYGVFNSNKRIVLLYNNKNMSKITLLELKTAYEELPEFLKPAIVKYDSNSIHFDNDSQITVESLRPDSMRGMTPDVVIIDEFAFVNKTIAKEFFVSHFPIYEQNHTKLIISSTPTNTKTIFYDIWNNASLGSNTFTPIRVYWWEIAGRDENWRDEMINFMGKTNFSREYDCKFEDEN